MEDKIQTTLTIICGGGLLIALLYGLALFAAWRADVKWKQRDANSIVAHNLLDRGEPQWTGRTVKDPGVRKVGRRGP